MCFVSSSFLPFSTVRSAKWHSGFTLTELIIVVAILVTLGTIAFASYSEYTISSRDAKRSSDLVTIRGNLSTYSAKNGGYPKPANFVEIRATTATGSTVLLRQGIIDSTLSTSLDIAGGGRDPSTNQGYTLSVDAQGKRAQVLAYFEKSWADAQLSARFPNLLESAYAEDAPLSEKFPISAWEKLWTFVQSGSLIPLEQTQTGSIALPTLSGSGFMVIGGCLTTERMTSVATGYPEGLYEGACEYIPYTSSVLNTMGKDGDQIVAYDNRVYTHDPYVIAANGGNPDFFDKRYKLIKINWKWWMNQNLAYPDPNGVLVSGNGYPRLPDGSGYSSWGNYNLVWCPLNTADQWECSNVYRNGYSYGSYYFASYYRSLLCPAGFSIPSEANFAELNDTAGWNESSWTINKKFVLTPVNHNLSYGASEHGNTFATADVWSGVRANIGNNLTYPNKFITKAYSYSWFWSQSIRCIRN